MNPPVTDTDDDFAERLRFWRAGLDLTQADAAERLGIDRAYLSQIEGGRKPGSRLRTRFLLLEKAAAIQASPNVGAAYNLRNLPVLSWAQAGQATEYGEIPADWEEVVPSDVSDQRAFGVRLRGDSMEPKFSDGDIAILLPSIAPTNGDIVVANLKDEGVLCKLMHVQLDKNLIILSSYNPAYPPMERHRDQFNWMFPVSSIMKPLRRK
jgi:SOS-response transcriptional repressor LexA